MLLVAVVLLAAAAAPAQQLNGLLTVGQSLQVGQTLISDQGIFVLGFFLDGDSTYLGIWYSYMKPQTVVWVANRDAPIKGGNGSLTLTANSLDLVDRRGTKVWTSGTFLANSPQSFLLDTGNLVVNDTTSDNPLWQSFDHPCDTLLPGLRIGYDTFTDDNWYLTSWKSSSDPSPGDYTIKIDPNRLPDLLLSQGAQLKYRTGTWNGQGFSGVPTLKANNQFEFTMTVNKGSAYYSFRALDRSILWRLVAGADGFIHRWHSNQSNEWVQYWQQPQDQCDYYAYCGPNAVCYNADCRCLQEFVPKSPSDWSQKNFQSGCVRTVELSCSSHNGFVQWSHVKVPDTLNATMVRGKSWDDCRKLCLGNCSCSAYTVFGDDGCVIWLGDLVDIVQLSEGLVAIRLTQPQIETLLSLFQSLGRCW